MVDITNSISYAVSGACTGFINTGVKIKKGLLAVGEGNSRVLHNVYSMKGFEVVTKATIANLRAISLIPGVNGVFDECLKTLEGQKDLIYATLVFRSTADFIKPNKDKDTGEVTSYSFQLPKKDGKPKEIDYVKLFYGIGNFFETGKFLQKYKIYAFPLCSRAANYLGSFKIPGTSWTTSDIPVLNCWFDKPKDFWVVSAGVYTIGSMAYIYKYSLGDSKSLSKMDKLKLISTIGKMILIVGGGFMLGGKWLKTLAFIDVSTQDSSLIHWALKHEMDLRNRMNEPVKFD